MPSEEPIVKGYLICLQSEQSVLEYIGGYTGGGWSGGAWWIKLPGFLSVRYPFHFAQCKYKCGLQQEYRSAIAILILFFFSSYPVQKITK